MVAVPTRNPVTPTPPVPQDVYKLGEGIKAPSSGIIATGPVTSQGAYNPQTGGYETIAPTAAVNVGAYSPEAKQAMWSKSGQTGSANQDAFFRKPDGTLGMKPEYLKNTNPNALSTADEMNAYLSGVQNNSFTTNGGATTNMPDYAKMAADIGAGLRGTAPADFSREKTYADMRSKYGISDLEGQIGALDTQYANEQATQRQRTQSQEGAPVAMGVIEGRVGEIQRQEFEKLDMINRQRSSLVNQLNVKNSLVENMIKLKGDDYDSANAKYNSEFTKNIQMMELARGISNDQISAAQKAKDDARATVTTVYNLATSGGLDPTTMTEGQKASFARAELQAGLPAGFINSLYNKNPKGSVVTSKERVAPDGNKYIDVVMTDEHGGLKTTSMLMGPDLESQKLKAETAQKTAAAAKASRAPAAKSGGAKKSTTTKASDPSADIKFYQGKVATGDISQEAAIYSIKAKYPEAAKKDLTPLFK